MRNVLAITFLLASSAQCLAQDEAGLSPAVGALLVEARKGNADAQFRVAAAYDSGQGAPRSGPEALKWYELAARSGHAEAQNSMGSALQAEGRYAEAFAWYELAAAQDHPLGINNLADMYNLGRGVAQDRSKAHELFLRSANLGWHEAMWNLANLYGAGNIGEKEDFLMACIWASRAIAHTERGSEVFRRASRGLAYAQSRLGKRERAQCRREARAWKPQPGPGSRGASPRTPTMAPSAGNRPRREPR